MVDHRGSISQLSVFREWSPLDPSWSSALPGQSILTLWQSQQPIAQGCWLKYWGLEPKLLHMPIYVSECHTLLVGNSTQDFLAVYSAQRMVYCVQVTYLLRLFLTCLSDKWGSSTHWVPLSAFHRSIRTTVVAHCECGNVSTINFELNTETRGSEHR